jgi:hypothetical protein
MMRDAEKVEPEDSQNYIFCPNSLRYDLAIGSNGWGMRSAAIKNVTNTSRRSNFTPHIPESGELAMSWLRPVTVERALARAHTYGLNLTEVHTELIRVALTCQCLEDLIELEENARNRLSRGTEYSCLVAALRDDLQACPDVSNMLEALTECHRMCDEHTIVQTGIKAFDSPAGLIHDPLRSDLVSQLGRFIGDMLILRDNIQSAGRRSYGKAAEVRAIEEWNSINPEEDQIVRGSSMQIHTAWFAGASLHGSLDGRVRGSGKIVEFKFRTTAFAPGGMIRDNEMMQVQAYLFMTQTTSAVLLEGVAKRKSLIIRQREVLFDSKLWEETTAHAKRLCRLQRELASHDLFRSAYFGLSMENQVRLVESVLLPDDTAAQQEAAGKRRRCE